MKHYRAAVIENYGGAHCCVKVADIERMWEGKLVKAMNVCPMYPKGEAMRSDEK